MRKQRRRLFLPDFILAYQGKGGDLYDVCLTSDTTPEGFVMLVMDRQELESLIREFGVQK